MAAAAGNDTLTVAGTVSGAGTIDLCGGDDTLTLEDGAHAEQRTAINGGAGAGDLLVLNNATAFGLNGSERHQLRATAEERRRHGHADGYP